MCANCRVERSFGHPRAFGGGGIRVCAASLPGESHSPLEFGIPIL